MEYILYKDGRRQYRIDLKVIEVFNLHLSKLLALNKKILLSSIRSNLDLKNTCSVDESLSVSTSTTIDVTDQKISDQTTYTDQY